MRMLLHATMDTSMGNEAVREGRVGDVVRRMTDRLRPEAVYFTSHAGRRSCYMVFDMQDSAQLPVISEPLFQELGAEIEIRPCMNIEDLQRGLGDLSG
ncbi:DUF3303 family protein [Streptomyces sp. DH12]|uniref:DUF3303 family protein n=1 Tax=Streptomyces sp. DH12 TaxID=2857010 RepID=UPI001E5B2944|nr:DUF3303 family protein [Streptomyces sp. DH12]